MSKKILSISEDEFMRIKAIVLDQNKNEAFHLIKEFLKRMELMQQKGLKSHLEC